ncbi:MAG: aromatic ring dioxygenase beta subunit [Bradyrhizobium sp.]|jgi:anthranilate 1,2-dioxygenase small subunit|nr:aromatic ring dioxygenase beta subunit [Bradyrhizobium sp.]MEA2868595.1 anthranilate 1,2-dioxygenase small subunit [Bradyrhizobium sp.]
MADKIRKIAPQPIDAPTYDMVADLISDYAHALDDGHIDRWPEFFTDSALYHVTTRENHDQGLPIGIIRCSGRGMMVDRVKAFHTANVFEPHSYNHLVGPAAMGPGKSPGAVASRCNFQIVRIMENGRMDLFATGKYLDEVVFEGGVPKLKERIVVLDSRNVDILIVVPL